MDPSSSPLAASPMSPGRSPSSSSSSMESPSPSPLAADAALWAAFAALLLAIHFALGNGYGFHRDELQFLDDARHLHWGFVAYPPLTSFAGRIAIALFGISPQVFRLPAALVNALSLVLAALTARQLGAGRTGQAITLVATFPLVLAFSSVLQYNTFDLLAWSLVIFFTARVLRKREPAQSGSAERNWLGVGLGVGLGILSKYTIALPVLSLLAGLLLLPSARPYLRSRWLWYGALLAALIAAPNLIWLASHHFITLQMEHFIHLRDVRNGRAAGFYTDQLKFTLFAFPLALAGLVSLLRSPRFRLLSAFYLGPFLLLALAQGRGYYLMPAYPLLYAAGAVALQRALTAPALTAPALTARPRPLRIAVLAIVFAALAANSAAIAWVFLPMWPVGSAAWNWQMKNNQDMANEVGWPEFVQQVAAVRDTLPPAGRDRLAVLANNFGEAGALELYGPRYGLPTPISDVNSFQARGFGPYPPETVIVLGSNLADQLQNFESCTVAATVHLPHNVRNEETDDHPQILVCHHLRQPWAQAWPKSQHFG